MGAAGATVAIKSRLNTSDVPANDVPQRRPGFFSMLEPEIRNIIYEFIFQNYDSPITHCFDESRHQRMYKPGCKVPNTARGPACFAIDQPSSCNILLTCRKAYSEGIRTYYCSTPIRLMIKELGGHRTTVLRNKLASQLCPELIVSGCYFRCAFEQFQNLKSIRIEDPKRAKVMCYVARVGQKTLDDDYLLNMLRARVPKMLDDLQDIETTSGARVTFLARVIAHQGRGPNFIYVGLNLVRGDTFADCVGFRDGRASRSCHQKDCERWTSNRRAATTDVARMEKTSNSTWHTSPPPRHMNI